MGLEAMHGTSCSMTLDPTDVLGVVYMIGRSRTQEGKCSFQRFCAVGPHTLQDSSTVLH